MKRFTPALALLLSLALTGCAAFQPKASPTRRVIAAQDTYSATLQVLTELRKAGKISDSQAIEIEKVRIVAAAALDLAKEQAKTGTVEPSDALAAFYKAIADINALLPKGETP